MKYTLFRLNSHYAIHSIRFSGRRREKEIHFKMTEHKNQRRQRKNKTEIIMKTTTRNEKRSEKEKVNLQRIDTNEKRKENERRIEPKCNLINVGSAKKGKGKQEKKEKNSGDDDDDDKRKK